MYTVVSLSTKNLRQKLDGKTSAFCILSTRGWLELSKTTGSRNWKDNPQNGKKMSWQICSHIKTSCDSILKRQIIQLKMGKKTNSSLREIQRSTKQMKRCLTAQSPGNQPRLQQATFHIHQNALTVAGLKNEKRANVGKDVARRTEHWRV